MDVNETQQIVSDEFGTENLPIAGKDDEVDVLPEEVEHFLLRGLMATPESLKAR